MSRLEDLSLPQGGYSIAEAQAVAAAALAVIGPVGRLYELGTWRGRSALMLSTLLPQWHITTIDSYAARVWDEKFAVTNPEQAEREAISMLATLGNVTTWHIDAVDAGYIVAPACVDLLHVDADHSGFAVVKQIVAWQHALAPRSVVALHDHNEMEGMERHATVELVASALVPELDFKRRRDLEAGSVGIYVRDPPTEKP